MATQNKVIKEHVVAFRLTPEQFKAFEKTFNDNPILGVKSPGMLARKLALDHSLGKINWKNKKEAKLAPEVYLAKAERPVATPEAASATA